MIIGDTASGKSSLLQAIIGEMIYMSDKTISGLGGMDATKDGKQFLDLQKETLSQPLDS